MEDLGRRTLEGAAKTIEQSPFSYPQLLIAVDFALGPTKEVVIAGDPATPQTAELVRMLQSRFLPRVVAVLHPVGSGREAIEALVPDVSAQGPLHGMPTAYVCENAICKLPTTDPATFVELLDQSTEQSNLLKRPVP